MECGPWYTFKRRWVSAKKGSFIFELLLENVLDHLYVCIYLYIDFLCIPLQNSKIRANFGSRPFAFAEGQAHRNAADLCVDLAEEISANFEALPFAMASDSDNDAGASVTSDSGSHGPPCRIAAVAVAQQRMSLAFI